MPSDIEKIKKLRENTGAGFKDCNSALEESKGDIEKAIEVLTSSDKLQNILKSNN